MRPILTAEALGPVREMFARYYTVDAVHEELGLIGSAALDRGDLAGVARLLRGREGGVASLIRLFLLGESLERERAAVVLPGLDIAAADGLLEVIGDQLRSRLDVRPYAEVDGPDWWVVSDFGSDVKPGPVDDDHVLGVGAASLTLAQLTVRAPVEDALDLGTGCGIQALHLSRHARRVVATDVSARALRLAAASAALSGVEWDLRRGSLLEPVADDAFDLVVANPPFVVSPGWTAGQGGYDYRDSGLAGDGVCRALLQQLPDRLRPGGTAQLLANWIIDGNGTWADRVGGWLAGRGCDAWIWQREVAETGRYVALWLRDAGEQPGTSRWNERYDEWMGWFDSHGVAAIGMGCVTLRRTGSSNVVCEDVPQAVEQPSGSAIDSWFERSAWLARTSDRELFAVALRRADDCELEVRFAGPSGWSASARRLVQTRGLHWDLEIDEPTATLIGGCDGSVPVGVAADLLAAHLAVPADDVRAAVAPVLRDLVRRGFLLPAVPEART